jgi:hypothetical protein
MDFAFDLAGDDDDEVILPSIDWLLNTKIKADYIDSDKSLALWPRLVGLAFVVLLFVRFHTGVSVWNLAFILSCGLNNVVNVMAMIDLNISWFLLPTFLCNVFVFFLLSFYFLWALARASAPCFFLSFWGIYYLSVKSEESTFFA